MTFLMLATLLGARGRIECAIQVNNRIHIGGWIDYLGHDC